jgi:RNA polymerase sigma-70 factor (ECF subfamily)
MSFAAKKTLPTPTRKKIENSLTAGFDEAQQAPLPFRGRSSLGDRDVTGLLIALSQGEADAREQLIPLVYDQLRSLAERSLRSERAGHTLQPTALVHELYQRLIDQDRVQWRNQAHFFAVAAVLMRRILVDHARRTHAQRRGGDAQKVPLLEDAASTDPTKNIDVLALDQALEELTTFDPEQAKIVELRFFGGLSVEETAEAVGRSRATVMRDWAMARAWLKRKLA